MEKVQGRKDARMQGCKDARMQGCKDAKDEDNNMEITPQLEAVSAAALSQSGARKARAPP
eukprot:scaffold449_cov241-Pinguiococcus_pyrenoidosus.AAC.20